MASTLFPNHTVQRHILPKCSNDGPAAKTVCDAHLFGLWSPPLLLPTIVCSLASDFVFLLLINFGVAHYINGIINSIFL